MAHLILASDGMPEVMKRRFETELGGGYDVLYLPPDPALPEPVAAHPDMIAFVLGDSVVMPAEYLETYPEIAAGIKEKTGIEPVASRAKRGKDYPDDIALNCAVAGDTLFCLEAHAAPEVVKLAGRRGLRLVNVRQGYAACSCLAAAGFFITADPSLAAAADAEGLDPLVISAGGISLPGYGTGFIGGASGVVGDRVFFFGDLFSHPDGEAIAKRIADAGYKFVCLGDDPLIDLGGLKTIRSV
ncbi:MAG: hypothetical protein IJK58_06485 [Clostridia bacterium]|nr:hypothetical protein [Clostridia bacterium]